LCLLFSFNNLSLRFLKKLFYILLNLGIEEGQSTHDKRRTKTSNLMNLIMVFFLLVGLTNYLFLKVNYTSLTATAFLSFSIISLLLNKFKKTYLSFLIFTLNVNLSIFYINKYYPVESGAYLFYFPLIVSVVLLNNPSLRDRHSLLHFLVCIFFFTANLLLDFPTLQIQTLSAHQIKLLWYYNLIISALITGVLSYLLTRIIFKQNIEILLQNNDLQ